MYQGGDVEEDKNGADEFLSLDKFLSELMGYHEQIKQLQASEVHYKLWSATLQKSLNQYQTVVDLLPQKVHLKDKNSSYLFANQTFARFLGVPPRQISGKTDHEFFPDETAEQSLAEDREVLEKGGLIEHEWRYAGKGKVKVERVIKSPVKGVSGETVGILGISWDITDQKAREEELEKKSMELTRLLEARNQELGETYAKFHSEQAECRRLEEEQKYLEILYGILFENSGTAVALIEDNKVIARVNREFEKLSGYSRAEVEGAKNWKDIIHPEDQENIEESAPPPDLISLNPGIRFFKFRNKQTKEKTVSMTAARIPGSNRIMVSMTDLTKYQQAREELDRVKKQVLEWTAEMERGVKSLDT
jgi:PAS domain S-box-containing protein